MNFKEMEYLLAVEQEKNLSKAARTVGISQPAMSKCLRMVEAELDVSQIEKISREYIPTAAGKVFLNFAKETKERKNKFLRELQELNQFKRGTIRVGITPARSYGLTPEVLPEFRKNFPDLRLEIYEEDVDKLEEMLLKGQVDVVYFVVDEDYRELHPEFYIELLGIEEIVLAVKKGTPLKKASVIKYGFEYPWVDITQFEFEPFITLNKDMMSGKICDKVLKEHHMSPEVIRFADMRTAHKLVKKGYGICICGSLGMQNHRDQFDIYSFGNKKIIWEFVATYRVGSYRTEPLQYLTQLYQKAADQEKNGQS